MWGVSRQQCNQSGLKGDVHRIGAIEGPLPQLTKTRQWFLVIDELLNQRQRFLCWVWGKNRTWQEQYSCTCGTRWKRNSLPPSLTPKRLEFSCAMHFALRNALLHVILVLLNVHLALACLPVLKLARERFEVCRQESRECFIFLNEPPVRISNPNVLLCVTVTWPWARVPVCVYGWERVPQQCQPSAAVSVRELRGAFKLARRCLLQTRTGDDEISSWRPLCMGRTFVYIRFLGDVHQLDHWHRIQMDSRWYLVYGARAEVGEFDPDHHIVGRSTKSYRSASWEYSSIRGMGYYMETLHYSCLVVHRCVHGWALGNARMDGVPLLESSSFLAWALYPVCRWTGTWWEMDSGRMWR